MEKEEGKVKLFERIEKLFEPTVPMSMDYRVWQSLKQEILDKINNG